MVQIQINMNFIPYPPSPPSPPLFLPNILVVILSIPKKKRPYPHQIPDPRHPSMPAWVSKKGAVLIHTHSYSFRPIQTLSAHHRKAFVVPPWEHNSVHAPCVISAHYRGFSRVPHSLRSVLFFYCQDNYSVNYRVLSLSRSVNLFFARLASSLTRFQTCDLLHCLFLPFNG